MTLKSTELSNTYQGIDPLWGKFTCDIGLTPDGSVMLVTNHESEFLRGSLQRTGHYKWTTEESARDFLMQIGQALSPNHRCLVQSMQLTEDDLTPRHLKYASLDAKVSFANDNYAWVDRTYGVEVHCDRQDGSVLHAYLRPNQPPVSDHARMEITLAQASERVHARWPEFDVSKFIYYLGWCKPAEGDQSGVVSYLFVRGTPHHPNVGSEVYYCEATPNGRLWMRPFQPTGSIPSNSHP